MLTPNLFRYPSLLIIPLRFPPWKSHLATSPFLSFIYIGSSSQFPYKNEFFFGLSTFPFLFPLLNLSTNTWYKIPSLNHEGTL